MADRASKDPTLRKPCLFRDDELFARSYAQYIAMRSDGWEMRRELNYMRERRGQIYYPTQWDDDDFEPIAETFDIIFTGLGWQR